MPSLGQEPIRPGIAWLGASGFPYGQANVQRVRILCEAMVEEGVPVSVVVRTGRYPVGLHPDLPSRGRHRGVDYVYASGSPIRSEMLLKRLAWRWLGSVNEWRILRSLVRQAGLRAAILSTHGLGELIRYRILSRVLGFSLILSYVEFDSVRRQDGPWARWKGRLLDRFFPHFVDGVLPISRFLTRHAEQLAPDLPRLELPIVVDPVFFGDRTSTTEPYFLFCGTLAYLEVVAFILDACKRVACMEGNTPLLKLVISGSPRQVARLYREIATRGLTERVQVLTELPQEHLATLYRNATGLLIPLRATPQDIARFPHKLGEYLASGAPVITTAVGEAGRYLTDGVDALVAARYDVGEFAEKMALAAGQPPRARRIGRAGRLVAEQKFNARVHARRLLRFVAQVRG